MQGEPVTKKKKKKKPAQFYLLGCREAVGKPEGKADGSFFKKKIFPGEFGILSYKKLQIIIFQVTALVRQMAQDKEQAFQSVSMVIAEEAWPVCNDVQCSIQGEGKSHGIHSATPMDLKLFKGYLLSLHCLKNSLLFIEGKGGECQTTHYWLFPLEVYNIE